MMEKAKFYKDREPTVHRKVKKIGKERSVVESEMRGLINEIN